MQIGDNVKRIESRESVKAVVIEISEDGENVKIDYEEGGFGWWPVDALEPDLEVE